LNYPSDRDRHSTDYNTVSVNVINYLPGGPGKPLSPFLPGGPGAPRRPLMGSLIGDERLPAPEWSSACPLHITASSQYPASPARLRPLLSRDDKCPPPAIHEHQHRNTQMMT